MTSLRLHLKVVSLNHYKVNSVSFVSVRTPRGNLGGFWSVYLHFVPCILYNLTLYISIYENIQRYSIKALSKFSAKRVKNPTLISWHLYKIISNIPNTIVHAHLYCFICPLNDALTIR